jgi:hypothetical protein
MTPQEERILNALTDHIRQTPSAAQNPELQQRVDQAFGRNPDVILPLAQAAISAQSQFEYARVQLQQAQAELAQLRSQPQPSSGGSVSTFFSNLFGGGSPTPQGPPSYSGQPQSGYPQSGYPGNAPSNPAQSTQGYQTVSPTGPRPAATPGYQSVNAPASYGQPTVYPQQQQGWSQPQPYPQQAAYGQPYPSPQPGYAPAYGWGAPSSGSGMMTRIAETAAGVAAGAVVAEGVESMLHGFGHERERGYSSPRSEEQYRDEPVDSSFYNQQNDASRDLSAADRTTSNFADTGTAANDWQDDTANADDSSTFDSTDDGSSFDDGGGDFGGGDNS